MTTKRTAKVLDHEAVRQLQSLEREFADHPQPGLKLRDGEFYCVCGNLRNAEETDPYERGFNLCDADGKSQPYDSEYECCVKCGRITHLFTTVAINRVVAHRPELAWKDYDCNPLQKMVGGRIIAGIRSDSVRS